MRYMFIHEQMAGHSCILNSNLMSCLNFRLQLDSLKEPLKDQYTRLLIQFGKEIDHTTKIYQKHKNDPPIGRDHPPIAGKISWARQLYRRIQEPMEAFKNHPSILRDPDAKKVIKNYNKTARVLLEFECLYYQAWSKEVGSFYYHGYHQFIGIWHSNPISSELNMIMET